MRKNEPISAWDHSIALLARKDYSCEALEKRLLMSGYDADEVSAVIDDLLSRGYLDDAGLAAKLASRMQSRKQYGRYAIVAKLRREGISSAMAEAALTEYSRQEELRVACRVLKAKYKQPAAANRRQAAQFLRSRGFSELAAEEALGDWFSTMSCEEEL